MSDQIRYTSYTVFKKIAGLNDEGTVTAELVAEDLQKTVAAIEGSGVQVLGLYDVSVFRAEDDLMVWFASEKPEGLQEALRLLEGSIAGTFLERVWSAAGHPLAYSELHGSEALPPGVDHGVPVRPLLRVVPAGG